jgi:hypothetical protein
MTGLTMKRAMPKHAAPQGLSMGTDQVKSVIVVSGLPRSGTSMMMQMLAAGGVPVITDHLRAADHDNPLGYYEFELVKQLTKDSSWLDAAAGKAVKIIYRLLYDLPDKYCYKVIFMRRKLEEIIASQRAMLVRLNREGAALDQNRLAHAFRSDLQKLNRWIPQQENFKVIYVNYDDVLYDSRSTVSAIEQFLDCQLDRNGMVKAIDRSLHRQKSAAARTGH